MVATSQTSTARTRCQRSASRWSIKLISAPGWSPGLLTLWKLEVSLELTANACDFACEVNAVRLNMF